MSLEISADIGAPMLVSKASPHNRLISRRGHVRGLWQRLSTLPVTSGSNWQHLPKVRRATVGPTFERFSNSASHVIPDSPLIPYPRAATVAATERENNISGK